MNVWLASFKGHHDQLISQVGAQFIRLMCQGVYSHNEIVIGSHPFDDVCRCISASAMDGGVREKYMQLDKDKWDVAQVDADLDRIEWWVDVYKGRPYDYFGAVAVRLPFLSREHPQKFFCSEACGGMLGLDEPWRLDPCALHVVVNAFLAVPQKI